MGNCFAPADLRDKAKRSKEVDAFLKNHGKVAREEIKLLLLGNRHKLFYSLLFQLNFTC